jgi:hypothetical protein
MNRAGDKACSPDGKRTSPRHLPQHLSPLRANIVAILEDLGVVQFQSAQQVIAHAIGSGVLADVALSELEKSGFEVRRK